MGKKLFAFGGMVAWWIVLVVVVIDHTFNPMVTIIGTLFVALEFTQDVLGFSKRKPPPRG